MVLNPVNGVQYAGEGSCFYDSHVSHDPDSPPVGRRFPNICRCDEYSRTFGIWTGEAPQPNEVWHL